MILHFNVKGEARKAMVKAIEQQTGLKARYLGMPSASYEIGDYTVGKNGELSFPDEASIESAGAVVDACVMATGVSPEDWNRNEETESATNSDFTVSIPADSWTDDALANLDKLVEAKAPLISSAFGAEEVKVINEDGKLLFPWFKNADEESTYAYILFVTRLCELAKNAKWVNAKERKPDNMKYAFRCFLLRLGFIGEEYKGARKALMKNLKGSSAFRNGGARNEISGQENG